MMRWCLPLLLVGGGIGWWLWPESTQSNLARADKALTKFDLLRAEELLTRVSEMDPENLEAAYHRGRLAQSRDDFLAAVNFFEHIPDDDPRFGAKSRSMGGLLFFFANQAKKAQGLLERASRLDLHSAGVSEALMTLYFLRQQPEQLRELMQRTEQFRPLTDRELLFYVTVGRTRPERQAILLLKGYCDADDRDEVSAMALARTYITDRQPAEAEKIAGQVFNLNPLNSDARAMVTEGYLRKNDVAAADRVLRETPPGASSSWDLWLSFAKFYKRNGDSKSALGACLHALAFEPDSEKVLADTQEALRAVGRTEDANRIMQRLTSHTTYRRHAALASGLIGANAPEWGDSLVSLGESLYELDYFSDAAKCFERALEILPENSRAKDLLAKAKVRGSEHPRLALIAPMRAPYPDLSEIKSREGLAGPLQSQNAPPKVAFREVAQQAGVNFSLFIGGKGALYIATSHIGGVAVLDLDDDGWPDLYFPDGCHLPFVNAPSKHIDRIFRNNRDGTFSEVTVEAGLSNRGYGIGCAAGDIDNDGFEDLVVANMGPKRVYRNNGDGTFSDVTIATSIKHDVLTSCAALGDLDLDGSLDLYFCNYVQEMWKECPRVGELPACRPPLFTGEPDALFQNNGSWKFADVSESAGIHCYKSRLADNDKGLGVVIADLNNDGKPDLYVANDTTPNFMFENLTEAPKPGSKPALKFQESGMSYGCALAADGKAFAGMGIACGDLDNNGWLDLYVTNFEMEYNSLFMNGGKTRFEDATRRAGLVEPTLALLGFGTQTIDVDLNGDLDLFVANGHVFDRRPEGGKLQMPCQLFYNRGPAKFVEITKTSGECFKRETLGRGLARLDWNRDGKPDMVLVNQNEPASLFVNETPNTGNFIAIDLIGTRANRDGLQTRFHVTAGGKTYMHELTSGDGFQASNEHRQIFGLGKAKQIEKLEVRWSSGHVDTWKDLAVNQLLLLVEGRAPVSRRVNE